MGLMGMAQVIATIAYGIRGLRRGETTWGSPDFDADPAQENLAQLSRWSLNSAPAWEFPPLAIANQYHDQQADEVKRARYRLILVRGSDLRWLNRERLQEVKTGLATQHKWLPEQTLPFSEVVLHAYAADRTPFPTYVCLPSGLYKARTGQVVAQTGPEQEILSLPGTVEVPFWPPCFYWFFGSCFGGHDEAGLLAFEALQGLPRPARGTHGRSYCGRNRL